MNSSKIYNRLAGGQKKPLRQIVGYIALSVITFAIVWFIVVMQISMTYGEINTSSRFAGILVSFVIAGVLDAIFIKFYAQKEIKQAKRKIEKCQQLLDNMSEVEFCELDRQMINSEFYFKTFYLLDEYLYVPDERLLIKYTDIASFRAREKEFSSGDLSADALSDYFSTHKNMVVWIDIVDVEGLMYKILVKDSEEYFIYKDMLRKVLKEKLPRKARLILSKC